MRGYPPYHRARGWNGRQGASPEQNIISQPLTKAATNGLGKRKKHALPKERRRGPLVARGGSVKTVHLEETDERDL